MRLAKLSRLPLLIAVIGSFSLNAFAIEATTNPVGVIQVSALGESDSLVSIPLKQPAVFNGVVASTAANVLTAEGSPGWTTDEWADSHYGFMRSGTAAGAYAGITANTANSITLDTDTLDDLVQGDSFSIHPFWTLDLLFPDGAGVNAASSHADRDSEIFIPSFGEGINLAADATYYYYDGAWKKVGGDLSGDFGGTVLLPDSYFILRNNSASSTTVTFTGEVVMGDLNLPLISSDQTDQDNIVGLQRPIEMTLDESGLGASLASGDQLLVWDLAQAKKNRLAADATVYTWDGAAWSGGTAGGADEVFSPGVGVLIRRVQGTLEEVDWSNSPNYGN